MVHYPRVATVSIRGRKDSLSLLTAMPRNWQGFRGRHEDISRSRDRNGSALQMGELKPEKRTNLLTEKRAKCQTDRQTDRRESLAVEVLSAREDGLG